MISTVSSKVLFSWVKKLVKNITSNLPMLIRRTKHDLIVKIITHIDCKSRDELGLIDSITRFTVQGGDDSFGLFAFCLAGPMRPAHAWFKNSKSCVARTRESPRAINRTHKIKLIYRPHSYTRASRKRLRSDPAMQTGAGEATQQTHRSYTKSSVRDQTAVFLFILRSVIISSEQLLHNRTMST
jgi:hypothetical protein